MCFIYPFYINHDTLRLFWYYHLFPLFTTKTHFRPHTRYVKFLKIKKQSDLHKNFPRIFTYFLFRYHKRYMTKHLIMLKKLIVKGCRPITIFIMGYNNECGKCFGFGIRKDLHTLYRVWAVLDHADLWAFSHIRI